MKIFFIIGFFIGIFILGSGFGLLDGVLGVNFSEMSFEEKFEYIIALANEAQKAIIDLVAKLIEAFEAGSSTADK